MVSKCANPECLAPFRYLHDGRLFAVRSNQQHNHDGAGPSVERYWLCTTCSDRMTLVMEGGRVQLRALASIPEATIKPQAAKGERSLALRVVA